MLGACGVRSQEGGPHCDMAKGRHPHLCVFSATLIMVRKCWQSVILHDMEPLKCYSLADSFRLKHTCCPPTNPSVTEFWILLIFLASEQCFLKLPKSPKKLLVFCLAAGFLRRVKYWVRNNKVMTIISSRLSSVSHRCTSIVQAEVDPGEGGEGEKNRASLPFLHIV